MAGFLHDVRNALRLLARRPRSAVLPAATLALGIGAATTAFAVVNGVLLEPLGLPEPGRLVRVHNTLEQLRESPSPRLAAIWDRIPLSYLFAEDLRGAGRSLAGLGLYEEAMAVVEGGREPEEVPAARVEPRLLRVLGVEPLLGRIFLPDDAGDGMRRVLLSHGLWRSAFGGDPAIVGTDVRIDGEPRTVVGVMPPGFRLPGREDRLWLPLGPSADDLAFRDAHDYPAIGRLAPGVSLAAAREELSRVAADLAAEHPATDAGVGVRLVPLLDTVVGDSRRFLGLLSIAAAVVLAVACVDVLHLLLVRGAGRRRELALRMALGARRGRLVRALAVDALAIALSGGAGGILLAAMGRRLVPWLLAGELPRLDEVVIDGRVLLFALAASLVAALAAGLAPALVATGVRLREAIGGGAVDRAPGAQWRGGGRFLLVVIEVALTMALACSAAFLAASWLRLSAVDPGFEADGVLVQELRLPEWSYPEDGDRARAADRIAFRLRALPGVRGVALTDRLPVTGPLLVQGFRIVGRDAAGGDWTQGRSAGVQVVTPEYVDLLGIPIIAGRGFGPDESRLAVLVDRSLAEKNWPEGGAVGSEIVLGEQTYSVLGVVGDVRHQGVAEETGDLLLRPWAQKPAASLAVLVRVGGDPMARAEEVRRAIHEIDPGLALPAAARLEDRVAGDLAGPRSQALFVGLSAGVALLLAVVGVFGVVAYGVAGRRREIAVRMALGADRGTVRREVLLGALGPALVGVALGAGAAVAGGRLLESLVFGAGAGDPLVIGAVAAGLLTVCGAAAWVPAARASRLDPARALAEPAGG